MPVRPDRGGGATGAREAAADRATRLSEDHRRRWDACVHSAGTRLHVRAGALVRGDSRAFGDR